MDSDCTTKSIKTSWFLIMFLLCFIFTKHSAATQTGLDEKSSALASPLRRFATKIGAVGLSSNAFSFQAGNSVVELRKLRRRPLVPPPPKPNGGVSYKPPYRPPPPLY